MSFLNLFRKKGTLIGQIVLRGLPPHKMYSTSMTFFRVSSATSPPPFDGDPPANEWTTADSVKEADEPDDKPLRFCLQKGAGFYYIGIGVIAYMERGGKMFAQVERFFPMVTPCQIQPGIEQQFELSVSWPDIPFDELPSYGTIYPSKK